MPVMADPFSSSPELPNWLKLPATPEASPLADALLQARMAAASAQSSPVQPPEKCPAVKLQDSIAFGRKLLQTKKLTKDTIVQWVRQVRFALLTIFGKDAIIFQNLDTILKNVQRQGMSVDEFSQKLADVESLSTYLNGIANLPLACPVSQTSRIPATKDVFIIHGHDELNTRR